MPRFNERLLDKLDAAADRTGVPAMVTRAPRRHSVRWLPIAALLFSISGMVLGSARTDLPMAGYTLVMIGVGLSVILPMIGPIKAWGAPDKVDEFDRALRSRAFLVTFASISVAAVIGMWLILGVSLIDAWPREILIGQISALSLFLITLYSAMPTLYASWAVRAIDDED
ncbi:MAG: hypothetical protein EOP61_04675 [Sphingomonadales bacterium]|nr:MAG: hypothetical protein EOP61_04675 [Sphingomonadales bacterium]